MNCPDITFENPFSNIYRQHVATGINVNRIPSMQEMDQFLSAVKCEPMYYLIFSMAMRLGLTATQITTLTRANVLTENDVSYLYFAKKDVTGKNDHYVKLPSDIAILLTDYITHQCIIDRSEHLFYNEHKNCITIKNIDCKIRQIIKQTGIETKFSFKDLRSRAILDMAHAGVEQEEIENYVGIRTRRMDLLLQSAGVIKDCPADLVNIRIVS